MTLDIDLWLWSLDQPGLVSAFLTLLTVDERARAARFVRLGDSERFIVGRGKTREILSKYVGTPADTLSFSFGPQGKPALPDGPAFNLSHSDGWAALVVAPNAAKGVQLGVDIEAEREVEDGVAARFFSASEYATLSALPALDWSGGFYRCWTRKEAVIKAAGSGLSTPLNSFDVTLAAGDPARLTRVTGNLAPVEAWSLMHLDLAPRFVGAIAAVTEGKKISLSMKDGSLPLR
ncbi:MAG: 4'-phosphopantetheinyl transferase superfamily protein [Rhodobacteraceae bacterium]|nr:4'-phosphopantetheinyl transferase superfamily protein [Paracoccaceae bacterium]